MIVIIIEKFFAHVTVIVLATKVIRNSMLFSITKMSGQKKERKKKLSYIRRLIYFSKQLHAAKSD